MAATAATPDGAVRVTVTKPGWFRRLSATLRRAARRVARSVSGAFRWTARNTVRLARKGGSGIARGARWTGRAARTTATTGWRWTRVGATYTVRGVGYVGSAAAWLLKMAVNLLQALFIGLVVAVFVAVSAIAFAVLTAVGGVYSLFDNYIASTFSWMSRSDRSIGWGAYRAERKAAQVEKFHGRAERLTNWAAEKFVPKDMLWEGEGDITVTTEAMNDPGSERRSGLPEETGDESGEGQPIDHELLSLPLDDTFAGINVSEGWHVRNNGISTQRDWDATVITPLFEGLPEDAFNDPHSIDFTVLSNKDALEAFRHLATWDDIETRSYFRGRHYAMSGYMEHEDDGKWNDLYGRYWALAFQESRHQQDIWSMKHMKKGFYDQVKMIKTRIAV